MTIITRELELPPSYTNLYIDSKIYIFQNCQMETAKEGNLLHSMSTCYLGSNEMLITYITIIIAQISGSLRIVHIHAAKITTNQTPWHILIYNRFI